MKGRIFAEWWVGCECGEAVPLVDNNRYKNHAEEARALGWRWDRIRGWLCPRCATKGQ